MILAGIREQQRVAEEYRRTMGPDHTGHGIPNVVVGGYMPTPVVSGECAQGQGNWYSGQGGARYAPPSQPLLNTRTHSADPSAPPSYDEAIAPYK